MSWMGNYRKELEKIQQAQASNIQAKASSSSTGGGNASGTAASGTTASTGSKKTSSYMNNYRRELARLQEEKEKNKKTQSEKLKAQKKEAEDRQKKEEERKWFQKGAFEDGYDFGDISKTILGTLGDVGENAVSGVAGMGEKAVDALAWLAPAATETAMSQSGGLNYSFDINRYRQNQEQAKQFIQKDLYDEQKVAEAIISAPMKNTLGVDTDTDSVFGEKSDSLIQSGGQLLATAGLQAVGVPWFLTTGATSFGSELEGAFNEGASYGEAGASAAISAGAEILSEKLSGGIKFGGKALDDVLTKEIARRISNKAGRTLARLGVDMAGEGAEEVFSQIASNLGSSLYKEEKLSDLLLSEQAVDEYLESFIGGAVLGGVSGGYKAVQTNSQGVDYASGMTANEQKVVDRVYEKLVTEAEQGEKISQKEKAAIYDQVLSDMEKGYISTDTIEEVLGGETYKAFRDTSEYEDSILKEYSDLGKKKDFTLADHSRYAELGQKVADIQKTSQKGSLKTQLNQEVYNLVKGDRLSESYNERARTGQEYTADLTQYDAKQQATIQKAVDSGILNNTNRTHEFVDFVAKISADTGVSFDFANNAKLKELGYTVEGATVDGVYSKKDGITVNIDSPKARQFVVGHEITHALEGTELYDALRKSVFDYAKAKNQYGVRMESIQKRYKEGTDFESELTADLVGEYIFSDTDFINNLSTQNQNVFQKVFDEIKYLCKLATAGSKEARELEKVKRAFEKAYREAAEVSPEAREFSDADTKFSIREEAPPKKTIEGYKVFMVKDGKLYPPMVANPEGEGTPVGVWLNADVGGLSYDGEGNVQLNSKGRFKVKAGGKGTQGSGGELAFRPGWHLGEYPDASQFGRENKERLVQNKKGKMVHPKELFPYDFVWARCEVAADNDYQLDAMSFGVNENGNFERTQAGLPYVPEDGYYKYRTNANPDTAPWIISGAIKVVEILDDDQVAKICAEHGVAPQQRQGFDVGAKSLKGAARPGNKIDLSMFGLQAGQVTPTAAEALERIRLTEGTAAERKAKAMEILKTLPGYAKRLINFDDANIVKEFGMNNQNIDEYRKLAEDSGHSYLKDGKIYSDTKYSLSDSDGKQLTKEQQDYFKDSKMRDENGNLKVMYHGSQDAGFHTFDASMSDDNTSFFFVDRNDVAASYSGTYETYEAKAFQTPEDANRFFESIGKGEYEVVEKDGSYALLDGGDEIATGSLDELYTEFCDYEGVGYGDANYKVYLNLKNPLEVDAEGRNWDNVSREFWPELYEQWKTEFTQEEKDALVDLAGWEDYATFKNEVERAVRDAGKRTADEHTKAIDSAYWKNSDISSLFSMAVDNFSDEVLKAEAVKQLTTRDYAQRAKEQGYDGVIFKNIVDNGGYSNGSEGASTVAIAFDSNQIKSVANEKPTGDADIRFSLSKPVEETKDLIAMHNLQGEQLLKSLELGGLPMPSIAVIKAEDGHSDYGEVSLILRKDAIDPKANKANKIYGGDAWTPVYPQIEYKPNAKVEKKISDKYYGLAKKIGYDEVRPMYNYVTDMERQLNNAKGEEGILKVLYDDTDMMNLYLQDSGKGKIEPIEKETVKQISSEQAEMNQFFIDALGEEVIANYKPPQGKSIGLHKRQFVEQYGESIRAVYKRFFMERYNFSETEADNAIDNTSKVELLNIVKDAYKYTQNKGVTVQTEVDTQATRNAIREAADGYKEWVDGLFKGIEEKTGIRNNQDYFTRSGNRRSWDALHWENTLENVVKAMKQQQQVGTGTIFSGTAIFPVASKNYGSLEDVKADSHRLRKATDEEYTAIKESFGQRFQDIATRIASKSESNRFLAWDNAMECMVDAVRSYRTVEGVYKDLKGYSQLNVTKQDAADLLALVKDISEMPTGYFEAKPQRAVGFDEVGVFVIPYDADVKLKQELLNRGYAIAEYDPKVEGDRQRVVNGFEEYKFSLSNVGEQHTPDSLSALRLGGQESGYRATLGKDVSLDAPVAENATTEVQESSTVAKKETVAEDSSVTADDMRELFPDDGVSDQDELDYLIAEESEIRGVMEAYAGVGDLDAVNKLIPEHEAIQERIKELQQKETDRADSFTDADIPPEMDAPLSVDTVNYNPFGGTTLADISRSTRSYSDQNPGARRFIEEGALGFLYDVNNSTHGERWYNDQLYYESGGTQGFGGTSRHTTPDIEDLKDTYGYSWDELRQAAQNVADGDYRSVAAKRVEYLVNKRLMEGYTDVDGRRIPANQEYVNFLNESFANETRQENIGHLLDNAAQYAPADIGPVLKPATEDSQVAPVFESKDKDALKGQTTMFKPREPEGKVAKILTEEPKTEKRRSKFWSLVKEHILDNGMVFEELSKQTGNREIEAKWNFIRYSQARAQGLIGNGTKNVKALKDTKKTVEQSGKSEQFMDYLYHKHNVDRMSLEDRFDNVENKPVFGYPITSEVSQRRVEQYERRNPEFMQWAGEVYSYMNHLRGLLVDNGVISQETASLWEKMYPHYVPIRRAGQDGLNINVPLDTYRTTVNNPVKRATGGNKDILPLFDTMAQRTIQTYKAIARNSFGIELKNQLGTEVEKNATTVDEVIEGIDTDDALLKPGERGENPTFTVFENGERVEFEITEEMYEAMKPKSEALRYRNKIFSTASGVFRGLTTQYSIPFMATNAIKDAQDVLINSQHPARTYANFPKAWYQQATDGKYYREYIENGGEDNTYFDNESTSFFQEDNTFQKVVKFPLNAISAANNFIELTPRLAEYIASREAGRSIEVSMLDAARVTTNFAAGGDLTKFVNANGATFLNASVQGAIQQVRNVREAHHKGVMGYMGLAARFALAGLPAVLLNNMLWDDDEDYEELADYVKQDYYVVAKYGDGKFIRIPKGRTVAVIQNAVEQVQNAVTGEDEVDLAAFLQLAVSNLAPNNPIENNILAPAIQAWNNETWYGEELVPSRLQDVPVAEQYDEKTDNFSRWLGEKLNVSPYKVNYLLNQYSGGLGDVVLPMMTPRAESGDDSLLGTITAPLRDKFTTDSVINSQVVTDFYDTKDELTVKANSSKATEDDYFRDLYMDTVGYELSDLYQQKREIQNSDLSDAEKYEQTRALQEQIVERMKESLDSYNDVHTNGVYAEVGDKRYNKDVDSGKWYEIKAKNADGSDNWYYQKEQEVTQGLGISYEEYWNNREEYNFAYDKPGKYAVAQAVGGYNTYMGYYDVLENWQSDNYISADKDAQGNSISGSRKKKVQDYINGLDIDYGEKIILYRTVYSSKADKKAYNMEIINYLNSRDDIDYAEMKSILEELEMEVDSQGNISW